MRELTIAGHRIADDSDAFTVAEIAANHQGSLNLAKRLIRAAATCGVDAVKFQKRDLATWEQRDPEAWHRLYESENSFGSTYGEHRAALEFDGDQYRELQAYAESLGLVFFATAWDVPSLRFLVDLGVPCVKLASASIVDEPLLEACSTETDVPLILSTGGANSKEIRHALTTIQKASLIKSRIVHPWLEVAILQCTAEYPCPPEDMNLNVIPSLREHYPSVVIGLSDHYSGIALTAASYLLGARIIEKHFCLHRADKGSDQALSLEPEGMRKLVRDLKRMRVAMGTGVKERLDAEVPALRKMGRTGLRTAAEDQLARMVNA